MLMASYEKVINKLYDKYDIPQMIPAPLMLIAKALGYGVYDFHLTADNKKTSGVVYYKQDDQTEGEILLNPNEPNSRKRFTLAHEIGHIVLKHQGDGEKRTVDKREDMEKMSKSPKEYAADAFAAELLMPAEEFTKYWIQCANIFQLAEMFFVSKQAALIRIENLGI